MLGRLFGNASSSPNSASFSRDSTVDEEYTRGLLYPQYASPQDAAAQAPEIGAGRIGEFDDWSGLELEASKDLRIIVAQDALGDSEDPCVLFDTLAIQRSESSTDLSQCAQNSIHRRGGSNTPNLKSPTSPLFPKPHQRISTNGPTSFPTRNRSSTFSGGSDEHDPRHIRTSDSEETRTILNCAFGSSAGASSGTKMHILSLGPSNKEPSVIPSSPGIGGNSSTGCFRKRESVTRAHTSVLSGARSPMHERSHSSSAARIKSTDAVLITKLFSVNLPEPTDLQIPLSSQTSQDGNVMSNHAGRPVHDRPVKGRKPRAKKTPMFAIILVVRLPINSSPFSRPPSRSGATSPPKLSSVRSSRNSFSSYPSSPRLTSSVTSIDRGDIRVNALVEHWDILDRTLTLLQSVSAPKIHDHLREADNFSAALVSKPSKPKEKTMQRTNQINIYLAPLVLRGDPIVKDTATQAMQRIRRALRIPRVTIGQERWGLWNDELIRIARRYGGTGQSLFLLTLLTSFLGAHTAEWVSLLAPPWYRQRQSTLRKTNEPDIITTRTVLISNDRSVARRLIFLLSSFLTAGIQYGNVGSFNGGSESHVSLRNAILRSPSPKTSSNAQRASSPERLQNPRFHHPQGGLLIRRGLQREPLDVHSIKSIPIPAKDMSIRKSSTATASTVTPHPTTIPPHFSPSPGPTSGYLTDETNASASLNKIWLNANRDSESSTTSTQWGSLMSGFWSKDSSFSASESTAPSTSSSMRVRKGTRLATMIDELINDDDSTMPAATIESPQPVRESTPNALPLNLQVNADEGVIDVDIGIPGFLSSSHDSGYGPSDTHNVRHVSSVASLDSLVSHQQYIALEKGSSPKSRVVGFLPRFHPDYSLQAVRVSKSELPDMIENVKTAMSSEPYSQDTTTPGWVDVSTTLIANVQTASVKRLRLKRKVSRLGGHANDNHQPVAPGTEPPSTSMPVKSSTTICGEFIHEEAFSYESVRGLDPVFTDAIERVLSRDNFGSPQMKQSTTELSGIHKEIINHSAFSDSLPPSGVVGGPSENLVIDALENIVKSVNHDLKQERKGQNSRTMMSERSTAQIRRPQDNALREGVRSWLLNAEHMAVW